jgi:hypothetical protein
MEAPVRATIMACAAAAACAGGCGEAGNTPVERPAPARAQRSAPERPGSASPVLITFKRVRYEGATLRILTLRADGSVRVDVPSGGAGRARFEGRMTPGALRRVRRDVERAPWRSLSRRRVVYDRSGAYFVLRHDGREHVAMADGMSPDLLPIVKVLNGVLNGEHRARWHTVSRFRTAS